MKVKSFRTSGILSNYFQEKRKIRNEKRVACFIFILLFLRFMYLSFKDRPERIEMLNHILSNRERSSGSTNLNLVD